MGDSRLYTSFDISSILSESSVSNLKHTKLHSINQIDSSKVEIKLVETLNQELVDLGYPAIVNDGELDLTLLVKNSMDLIKSLKRSNYQIEKIQDHCVKLDQENDIYFKRQQALKEEHEASTRELGLNKEKFRQLQAKLDESTKTIKSLNDQIKRIQAQKDQSEKLFKNERTKIEKERDKLKTRLQTLLNARIKEFQTIDMSSSLVMSPSKSSLSPDSPNKKMDAYGELIKDYDYKLRILIMEISELKTFVCHVFGSLDSLVDEKSSEDIEEIIKLPFDSIYKQLNQRLGQKLKLLSNQSTTLNHDISGSMNELKLNESKLATPSSSTRQLNSSSQSSFVSNDC